MNIHHLQVLATFAQLGSFSGAALVLDISQAAVSRAIATLEDELGVPLLKRGRFGARLTPVGERVLHHGQGILELREHIDYEVNLEKGLYGGRVRIASFRSAATHLLPAAIATLAPSPTTTTRPPSPTRAPPTPSTHLCLVIEVARGFRVLPSCDGQEQEEEEEAQEDA